MRLKYECICPQHSLINQCVGRHRFGWMLSGYNWLLLPNNLYEVIIMWEPVDWPSRRNRISLWQWIKLAWISRKAKRCDR